MHLLLDTHALLWWLADDPRLSDRAARAIGDDAGVVFVSAASAWEVATKFRLGKLPGAEQLVAGFGEHIARQGFTPLDITIEHGQRAGSLPGPHRDPFDRMLVAQAHAENLAVVSNEAAFDGYGVRRVW